MKNPLEDELELPSLSDGLEMEYGEPYNGFKIPMSESLDAVRSGRDEVRSNYEIDYDNLRLNISQHWFTREVQAQMDQLHADYKNYVNGSLWDNHKDHLRVHRDFITRYVTHTVHPVWENRLLRRRYEREVRSVPVCKPLWERMKADPLNPVVTYRKETFDEFRARILQQERVDNANGPNR